MYSREKARETNHIKHAMAAYSPWMPAAVKLIVKPQKFMQFLLSFLFNAKNKNA